MKNGKNKIEHNDEFELLDIYYKTRKDTGRNETWEKLNKDCGTTFNRIHLDFYNGRKSFDIKFHIYCIYYLWNI